jgi:UDP-3-O-[3-hydroxymyristoyl] glucosamine N-acyltransferase
LNDFSKFPSNETHSLSWFAGVSFPEKFDFPPSSLLVCSDQIDANIRSQLTNFISTKYPKYVFALLATFIREGAELKSNISSRGIHPSVEISGNSTVGDNVEIGPNTVVLDNVTIGSNVRIGSNCVIGSPGFGFAKGPNEIYIRVPHIGGVLIGNNVEIGNNVCIDSGTFDATVISDLVKIDNLVHIAHNVTIGERTLVTACAEISGSVTIGSDVWIAPNVSIIQKISIGNGALVGIGSTVTKDVPEGLTVFGSPARAVPGKA